MALPRTPERVTPLELAGDSSMHEGLPTRALARLAVERAVRPGSGIARGAAGE